jgi:hypothetical protein
MKKTIIAAIFAAAVLAALPASAQASGPVNFYIRLGVITDQNATFNPFLWTAGANLDINLSDSFFIAADADVIVHKFNFDPLWLTPSVLLNLRLSSFYIGAGVSKFVIISGSSTMTSDFLFKANAGLKMDGLKLQVFLYTPFDEMFKDMGIGANIGFGF